MVWAADIALFRRNVIQYCEFPGPKLPGVFRNFEGKYKKKRPRNMAVVTRELLNVIGVLHPPVSSDEP